MDDTSKIKGHFHRNREMYGFATYAIGNVAAAIIARKLIEKAFMSYADAKLQATQK